MPELLDIGVVRELHDGRGRGGIEFGRAIGLLREAEQLFLGEFLEIELHDLRCPLRIGQTRERADVRQGQLRNGFRQIQTAVAAEALHDGLAGGQTAGRIPGTYIMHVFTTFIKELQNRFCMVSSGYPASAR